VLSTFSFDYIREAKVSDFPIELGSFAAYNKVQNPANPMVTLILDGTENDRTTFLTAMESAVASTDLYSVVTPEVVYVNYSIERFSYSRKASKGATLLYVEVSLKEIRQITAAFAQVSPISSPADPAATTQESNGLTQTAPVPASTLLNLSNGLSSSMGSMFNGGG
jgi:hypothetical protein